MAVLKFVFSKIFWINLLIATGLFLVSIAVVNFMLKSYTKHKESITVPDLTGFTMDELEEYKRDRFFKFMVNDSLFDPKAQARVILDQDPKPDSKVKENRTIYLTINASKAPEKPLPDLVGKSSYRNARMILENEGFQIDELIYKPHPYENEVLDVLIDGKSIKAGSMISVGSKLDLVLGNGLSNEKVEVPRLLGMNLIEAEMIIKDKSLNLGSVIFDRSTKDSSAAVIYRQIPPYGIGRYLKMGEPIDVFLSESAEIDTSNF
ncbi:MAG: PASTA domain-containing protein [Chitinophagales bacterium]|nr:PASTA domain-containing protein [Chitinophagales bacterium]